MIICSNSTDRMSFLRSKVLSKRISQILPAPLTNLERFFLVNSDTNSLSGIVNRPIMPATLLTTPLNQRVFAQVGSFA